MNSKTRVQLDMSEQDLALLDELASLMGGTTRSGAVRSSVKLAVHLLRHQEKDGRLILKDRDGNTRELLVIA